MIGQVVGSYRVVSELGRGGMGLVMLAEHIHLNRSAAIKFLQRNLCDNAEAMQRFLVEARATAEIKHPGIVQIYDCGILPDGIAFIIMELLEGETLQASLNRRGLWPIEEVATTMIQIADGLAAAHKIGIVHRDLKPDNIFLLARDPGRVKLVDFGIAKLAERDYSVKTLSGMIMGTPRYMSPEQCRGSAEVDYRSDLYSLGCVFFEMLTGQPVFPQDSFGQVIAAHQLQEPPTPRVHRPDLPPDLAALVLGLLAKKPEDRPSLAEIQRVLIPYAPGVTPPPQTNPFVTPPPVRLTTPPDASPSYYAAASAPYGHANGSPHTPPDSTGASYLARAAPPVAADRTPGVSASVKERRPAYDTTFVPMRRDRQLIAAGAIAVVVIAVVALVALRPHKSATVASPVAPPPPQPQATIPAPPPPPRPVELAPPPVAEPHPVPTANVVQPQPKPAPPVRPAVASQPATVKVMLSTAPADALICDGADRIGVTNSSVSMHRSGKKQTLVLYKSGYRQETVTLVADRDVTKFVKLHPLTTDDLREPPPCR
jgi:serine/threonine protein kinase